ncbi:MAG: AI-2E family transporter [Clostridia bacterium]|nr:AI-2E family transporter [Clostridia bacterium]
MSAAAAQRRFSSRHIHLAVLAAAAGLLLILLRRMIAPLLFQTALAVLLAWTAAPLCRVLERRLPGGLAALLSLLALFTAVIGLLGLLIPQLISQVSLASGAVPQLIDSVQHILDRLEQTQLFSRLQVTLASSEELLQRAGNRALEAAPHLMQRMAGAADRLGRAFLSPVLAFYFLRDRDSFCFQASLLIPLRYRRRLLAALREMRREITAYFRGQLLVSLSVALLTALGLLIVGVPAWLLLGAMMGVCDLIPYMGPYLGAIPVLLFSLPQGMYTALWAMVALAAVQQFESVFLSPRLMSGATGLHPAYVLLLLSAGGLAAGLPGMLLSLPLFVCLRGAVRALQCAKQEEMP